MDGFLDKYYFGRNPTDLILANYKNLHRQETDYFGGYTTFLSARRGRGDADSDQGIGADFQRIDVRAGRLEDLYVSAG